MTVQEVLLEAAQRLGIEAEVQGYFNGTSSDGKTAELLLNCFNIVENELALDYLPLYAEDEVESELGQIYFSKLSKSAVRILSVTDEWENRVKFKLFPKYMLTQPGKVLVRYTFTPEKKEMDDDSDFILQASSRLLALGIAAEYCIATGLYEEAEIWDKKYKNAIAATYENKRCERIVSRRWV